VLFSIAVIIIRHKISRFAAVFAFKTAFFWREGLYFIYIHSFILKITILNLESSALTYLSTRCCCGVRNQFVKIISSYFCNQINLLPYILAYKPTDKKCLKIGLYFGLIFLNCYTSLYIKRFNQLLKIIGSFYKLFI
jgi:hypothetical protein